MSDKHSGKNGSKLASSAILAPQKPVEAAAQPDQSKNNHAVKLGKDCDYEKELRRLQVELAKLQEWIRHEGLRVVAIFEGRDAAGKGGVIKRISEALNPRICRIVVPSASTSSWLSPQAGSSSRRSFGEEMSARASSTRFCVPKDRSATRVCATSSRPR